MFGSFNDPQVFILKECSHVTKINPSPNLNRYYYLLGTKCNVFTPVCQSFCPQTGHIAAYSWAVAVYPSMHQDRGCVSQHAPGQGVCIPACTRTGILYSSMHQDRECVFQHTPGKGCVDRGYVDRGWMGNVDREVWTSGVNRQMWIGVWRGVVNRGCRPPPPQDGHWRGPFASFLSASLFCISE